jgi:hypothetical protein
MDAFEIKMNLNEFCGCPAVKHYAAVRQCAAVRAAVCESAHGSVREILTLYIIIIIIIIL